MLDTTGKSKRTIQLKKNYHYEFVSENKTNHDALATVHKLRNASRDLRYGFETFLKFMNGPLAESGRKTFALAIN